MSPRILIAFYSMTGNTRGLANEIRELLLGHLEEIAERRPRKGFPGVARALFDAVMRREPRILPPARDPALYDLLVLGGPVWAGRMAAPVRSYARRHGVRASKLAFFCTQGGSDAQPAFADLARLCGREPVATLAVPALRLAADAHRDELQRFVERLGSPVAPAARSLQAGMPAA